MHSLQAFGLGIFFALAGIGLFALTLRKTDVSAAPARKSAALREQRARRTEVTKLRIAGAVSVLVGALLMVIS